MGSFEQFLEFLKTDPESFEKVSSEAEPINSEISQRIGSRDYWQVSPRELKYIYAAVKIFGGRIIAETGVGPGTSSYAILKASEGFKGHLYSFDLGEPYGKEKDMPVGFMVPDNYRERFTLILGDTNETLERNLIYFGPFDVFFHDSEHTFEHVMFELETARKNLRSKFLIIVDNYDWSNAPEKFAEKYGYILFHPFDDICFIFPEP
jgi:predicted O-methyltransferase YrrM